MTTPESRPAWGDFKRAAAYVAAIPEPGIGSRAGTAHDAPDVRYVKIMSDVSEGYIVTDEQPVEAEVVTLIWRPEFGSWLVHSIGGYEPVDDLPRSARGQAP